MKFLKYLFLTLAGLAAFWVLLCFFAKKSYRIERSMEIEAPYTLVYDQVRLFKNFSNWSPWHYLDPQMKTSIEGPDGEVGAVYRWQSANKSVGSGYQKILAVSPNRLDYELDFGLEPSTSYFLIAGDTLDSKITWVVELKLPFLLKAAAMLTDVNTYVGKDYENGLANLRKYCEALTPKMYLGFAIKSLDKALMHYVGVRQVRGFAEIDSFLATQFPVIAAAMEKGKFKRNGPPCGLYWTYDTLSQKSDMAAVFPLEKQVKSLDTFQVFSIGGEALMVEYLGNPAKSAEAHGAVDEYLAEKKKMALPPILEEYVTDPATEPDTSKWLTRIYYFLSKK